MQDSAEKAILALNMKLCFGETIKVSWVKPNPNMDKFLTKQAFEPAEKATLQYQGKVTVTQPQTTMKEIRKVSASSISTTPNGTNPTVKGTSKCKALHRDARGKLSQGPGLIIDEKNELKNPASSKESTVIVNQSINHRLSSIVHGYNSCLVSRAECDENMSGVQYALEVSSQCQIENLDNALKRVHRNQMKDEVESLGLQLIKTLGTVDWTKLASFYKRTATISSAQRKMTDTDVLAKLNWNDEKNIELERRMGTLKNNLRGIVSAFEDIEEGEGVHSVPDVEESLTKVKESLDQPALKLGEDMIVWARLKIEDVLDMIDTAWNLVQGVSDMRKTLQKIDNPLKLFGNKYCTKNNSENVMKEDEIMPNLKAEEKEGSKINRNSSEAIECELNQNLPNAITEKSLKKSQDATNQVDQESLISQSENVSLAIEDLRKFEDLSNDDTSTPFVTPNSSLPQEPQEDEVGYNTGDSLDKENNSQKSLIRKPTEKLKSTETGYMQVQELKTLVETYTEQCITPQLKDLLNLLDRDHDGWVLYEEFEDALTSEILKKK